MWSDKIVVSDIDGTITKSDVMGHIAPVIGVQWAHSGVVQLYNRIVQVECTLKLKAGTICAEWIQNSLPLLARYWPVDGDEELSALGATGGAFTS